jgi:hypothetical protein
MNEQMKRLLKDNMRKTEADLSHWKIELHKRMEAAAEAEQFVEMLQQGLNLLKLQLGSLGE